MRKILLILLFLYGPFALAMKQTFSLPNHLVLEIKNLYEGELTKNLFRAAIYIYYNNGDLNKHELDKIVNVYNHLNTISDSVQDFAATRAAYYLMHTLDVKSPTVDEIWSVDYLLNESNETFTKDSVAQIVAVRNYLQNNPILFKNIIIESSYSDIVKSVHYLMFELGAKIPTIDDFNGVNFLLKKGVKNPQKNDILYAAFYLLLAAEEKEIPLLNWETLVVSLPCLNIN